MLHPVYGSSLGGNVDLQPVEIANEENYPVSPDSAIDYKPGPDPEIQPETEARTDVKQDAGADLESVNLLQFPASASTSKAPEMVKSASTSNSLKKEQSASTSTFRLNVAGIGFAGIARNHPWRPKKTIKNPKYPKIAATGCYFQDHSGGFVLIHRKTHKYLGHYTKSAIAKLEAKYGKNKTAAVRQSSFRSGDNSSRRTG